MTDIDTEQTQPKRGRPVGTTRKTPAEVSQNQREASSRWYYNNHEYRCNQKKKYYEENRDRILEQRKQNKNVTQSLFIFQFNYIYIYIYKSVLQQTRNQKKN